jgi:hypothetical protein
MRTEEEIRKKIKELETKLEIEAQNEPYDNKTWQRLQALFQAIETCYWCLGERMPISRNFLEPWRDQP